MSPWRSATINSRSICKASSGILPTLPYGVLGAGGEGPGGDVAPSVWSYVAGGAGDERTQRVNITAFEQLGRDATHVRRARRNETSRCDRVRTHTSGTPVFMAPIGVIGLYAHRTGTATWPQPGPRRAPGCRWCCRRLPTDPLEDVAAEFGETPGFFQLYTPTDRDLAASLVHAGRSGGVQGHRRHARHLGTGLAAARPRRRRTSPSCAGSVCPTTPAIPYSAQGWRRRRRRTPRRPP